jgi:hypothetical protein
MLTGPELGSALKEAMRLKKVSPTQLATAFGIRAPSVYTWVKTGRIDKKHLNKMFYEYFIDVVPLSHWGMPDGNARSGGAADLAAGGARYTIKPGNKNNPEFVGRGPASEAQRELLAVVLGAGRHLPEDACRLVTELVRKLATAPVKPDPGMLTMPLWSETKAARADGTTRQRTALKKWSDNAIFK